VLDQGWGAADAGRVVEQRAVGPLGQDAIAASIKAALIGWP
jgi:preprotein translocase subunit SecD